MKILFIRWYKLMFLSLILLFGCKDYSKEVTTKTIRVYLVNGREKIIKVKVPVYTTFSIHSSTGTYRLSYWEYGLGGLIQKEKTIKHGVIDFEIIN